MNKVAPHKLTIANDRIEVAEQASVRVNELGLDTDMLVMDESPSVSSLGRLCMTRGYAFRWEAQESPCLILPNGKTRVPEVDHYLPLLAAAMDRLSDAQIRQGNLAGAFPAQASGVERPAKAGLVAGHLLADSPRGSRREECMNAKAQHTPYRRRSKSFADPSPDDDASAEKLGDLVTADHCVTPYEAAAAAAREGSMYGLMIQASHDVGGLVSEGCSSWGQTTTKSSCCTPTVRTR